MVKINSASAATIASLPGIGRKLALRIVAHRTRYGFFSDASDLAGVDRLSPRIVTLAQNNIDWSIPSLATAMATQKTVTPLTFGEMPSTKTGSSERIRQPWLSSGFALLALGIGIWPQLMFLLNADAQPLNTESIIALSWTTCLISAVFGCINLNWQQQHNVASWVLFFIAACALAVLAFSLHGADDLAPLGGEITKLTAIVLLFAFLVAAPHFLQSKLGFSVAQTTQFNLYLLAILVVVSLAGVQLSYFTADVNLRIWLCLLGGLSFFDGIQSLRQKTPHRILAVVLSVFGAIALISATLV